MIDGRFTTPNARDKPEASQLQARAGGDNPISSPAERKNVLAEAIAIEKITRLLVR
jgi:hypothetical protein